MPKKTDSSFLHAHAKLSAQARIKRHTKKWWHDAHCEACQLRNEAVANGIAGTTHIVQGGNLFDLLESLMGQAEQRMTAAGIPDTDPSTKPH